MLDTETIVLYPTSFRSGRWNAEQNTLPGILLAILTSILTGIPPSQTRSSSQTLHRSSASSRIGTTLETSIYNGVVNKPLRNHTFGSCCSWASTNGNVSSSLEGCAPVLEAFGTPQMCVLQFLRSASLRKVRSDEESRQTSLIGDCKTPGGPKVRPSP